MLYPKFTIGLAILLFAQAADAQDKLPPVRQLIDETLKLCRQDREEHFMALGTLAESQAYLSDFSAARKTLLLTKTADLENISAAWNCAQIEIELTGSVTSVPDALWTNDKGTMYCKAALAFIQRGEIDKALAQVEQIPDSPHSALNVFGIQLIENLKSRKAGEIAQKVALAWASRLENADFVTCYRPHYEISRLVSHLVEFNERPIASTLCNHWHSVLKAETNPASPMLLGKAWAEYSAGVAVLGDKDRASAALEEASAWVQKSYEPNIQYLQRSSYRSLAEGYAAVASRQAVIFGTEKAISSYNRAYEYAGLSVDPRDLRFGDFAYELIVSEQLTGGDEGGARETIKRIPTPRTTARCWLRISSRELSKGDLASARETTLAAVQILDRDGFEPPVAEEMALAASNAARAGEKEIAQKLFARAIALSQADKSPQSSHPHIASFQAHGGLLIDAYLTIQSITKQADRAQPLADLCLVLAKAESESRSLRR